MNQAERGKLIDEAKGIREKHGRLQKKLSQLKSRYSEIQEILSATNPTSKISSSDNEASDFRNASWGMSREQVRRVESAKEQDFDHGPDHLYFNDEVAAVPATVIYNFHHDVLLGAHIMLTEEHMNPNNYISDFERFKDLLTSKYGDPMDDTHQLWSRELYQDDPNDWGQAVEVGDLVYVARWQTTRSNIRHILNGDNFEISHFILYHDISREEEIEARMDGEHLSGL